MGLITIIGFTVNVSGFPIGKYVILETVDSPPDIQEHGRDLHGEDFHQVSWDMKDHKHHPKRGDDFSHVRTNKENFSTNIRRILEGKKMQKLQEDMNTIQSMYNELMKNVGKKRGGVFKKKKKKKKKS